MSTYAFIPSRSLLVLFTSLFGFALPVAAVADARVSESYGKLPLHFEANHGQTHEDVRFLSRGPGYSLYLTAGEAVLVLAPPKADAKAAAGGEQAQSAVLRMGLVGAARKPVVTAREELPGKANYFIGGDPAKWRTNVPTYGRVHYREVYPGIDLVYYGNQRSLEYDFIVAPGADPKKIVLAFRGADKLEIDAQGDLVLHTAGGAIHQKKPVIYQEVDGVRQEIAGSYVRKGAKRVGFKVAAYDRSRSLIIDPVLSYSTYLGGSDRDSTGSGFSHGTIAVDSDGNAYVTGTTGWFGPGSNFPTTPGAFQSTIGNDPTCPPCTGGDAFVTKLNPTGTGLVYSTFLGGSGSDEGIGIAVDTAGGAYVTGMTTSSDFPTTAGAFRSSGGGAFVTKLNPTGSALIYSTHLGGIAGTGIAVDTAGSAYVTGYAGFDFPTTPGAFDTTPPIRDFNGFGNIDSFVTKLHSTGSILLYSTYLGGSGHDHAFSIAVDADGNAYVTGRTDSHDFPATAGAVDTTYNGDGDVFVTKLNPAGSALVYSTYLGGGGGDQGRGIAVDAAGNAYVTGSTGSSNFPTTAGSFQPIFGSRRFVSDADAFVTKLNPEGSTLVYSTYLGGNANDNGFGIAVDAAGNAYVTGNTDSSDFPTTATAFDTTFNGGVDAFVTKLDPTGSSLLYSTYLGGGGELGEAGTGIAVDTAGNAYVTGVTSSSDFPTTPGAFQTSPGGGQDAFVAKIAHDQASSSTTRFEESAAAYSGQWTTYGADTGTFSGGTVLASNVIGSTATFSFTGTAVSWIGVRCTACGIATVSIDGGPPATVNTSGPAESGSLRSEVVFSASGLAPDVNHTLAITVTGTTTSLQALLLNGTNIAVDAFDVTR
jgi:hypothetical protein